MVVQLTKRNLRFLVQVKETKEKISLKSKCLSLKVVKEEEKEEKKEEKGGEGRRRVRGEGGEATESRGGGDEGRGGRSQIRRRLHQRKRKQKRRKQRKRPPSALKKSVRMKRIRDENTRRSRCGLHLGTRRTTSIALIRRYRLTRTVSTPSANEGQIDNRFSEGEV